MSGNRPTKKQRELLSFIDGFIKGNGFGPSYREIMRALDYKSVSTVAVHIDGLIARGLLRKQTHSARSLEVISMDVTPTQKPKKVSHIVWLKEEIEKREKKTELADQVKALKAALAILDQTEEK